MWRKEYTMDYNIRGTAPTMERRYALTLGQLNKPI